MIASLDLDPEVEEAWEREADRREAELESGSISAVPGQEAVARLRAKIVTTQAGLNSIAIQACLSSYERESHYVWGKRYLLKIEERDAVPEVELRHSKMILRIRPGTTREKKQRILEAWYRDQLKVALPPLLAKWESLINVKVGRCFVQKMRTKWGSCSHDTHNIRLNTDLAKKPPECLEYIVVHELAHLLEPTHNQRFITLMDQFMPKWKFYKDQLNRLPVRHEDWGY